MLKGKVALVTGGGSGIGRATAFELASQAAAVVACDRNEPPLSAVRQEAQRDGHDLETVYADVRVAADAASAVRFAVERWGGLDILVNAAGLQAYGTVEETTEELWDEVMAVNLRGSFLASRSAIPEMRKRGGGAIVNVSSVQATATQAGVAAYAASKGGINALTRAMALDHAGDNIRVNAVCPGSIDTPMLRASAERFRGDGSAEQAIVQWGRMHPIGRVGRPEEVAKVIAFLAGPESTFITGSEYRVDGGLLAALGVRLPEP